VLYVNDSKATNVDSTLVALASFEGEPVHLILGGGGKGQDFMPLREPAARCAGVYLIGTDGPAIGAQIGTGLECGDLATAVGRARATARPGEVVLLSPACESYDQFDSYEHRGRAFKELVQ
jgi:UDP-N-acetylmuramoylalanine--D-glutamate ligase